MVGCRLCGTLLLVAGLAGVALQAADGYIGAAVEDCVSGIQAQIDTRSPFIGVNGAIPAVWMLRLIREFSVLALSTGWFASVSAITAGLLMLLRRRWHSNHAGRPHLDGMALIGIAFLAAWNLSACIFIFHSVLGRFHALLSAPPNGQLAAIWTLVPLWGRSLVCYLNVFVCLAAIRAILKRQYTGVYWLVAVAVITIADNSLSMILSGLDGVTPLACALACWPAATAAFVWWYFLRSDQALEYFD